MNVIAPGTIDERRIRINVAPKDAVFAQNENLSLAIDGCKRIGLVVANLGVGDLASGSVCYQREWKIVEHERLIV